MSYRERLPQKRPGTFRRPPGTQTGAILFEPVNPHKKGPKMYAVTSAVEYNNDFVEGLSKRTPPLQFDALGNPIGRWWPEEQKGIIRKTVGVPKGSSTVK